MIGFSRGSTENADKTWRKTIRGRTIVFTKTQEKAGIFLYNCESGTGNTESSTGFRSDRDLAPDEVEQLPQFADFIAGAR